MVLLPAPPKAAKGDAAKRGLRAAGGGCEADDAGFLELGEGVSQRPLTAAGVAAKMAERFEYERAELAAEEAFRASGAESAAVSDMIAGLLAAEGEVWVGSSMETMLAETGGATTDTGNPARSTVRPSPLAPVPLIEQASTVQTPQRSQPKVPTALCPVETGPAPHRFSFLSAYDTVESPLTVMSSASAHKPRSRPLSTSMASQPNQDCGSSAMSAFTWDRSSIFHPQPKFLR
ncbi:hypothetical protein DIPPA_33545 [Diplonema papillatum]|nr:hypothetical protein DIPPA_25422 [Diplonema papillatum]KAJ9456713.1 hypothetical protein DIPPA_33545 [Diplonema papillatum]